MGNPRARWPWLACAAVLLYLGAGVAAARCPSWEECWRREIHCDHVARAVRYRCRALVRGCFEATQRCTGGVRQ